ncbi:MAG: hypothetical protein R3E53_21620 [Myxococcota bacterium]
MRVAGRGRRGRGPGGLLSAGAAGAGGRARTGRRLRAAVEAETGLPLQVGVAPVRFAARMVAGQAGRGGVRIVLEAGFEDWLLAQRLEELPGVGPKTAARLAELGAVDVPTLALDRTRPARVLLGPHGRALWLLACGGIPGRSGRGGSRRRSAEETLAGGEGDPAALAAALGRLCERLDRSLARDGLRARRLALRLTLDDSRTLTRSRTLEAPVASAGAARGRAIALRGPGLRRAWGPPGRPRPEGARGDRRRGSAARPLLRCRGLARPMPDRCGPARSA